MATNENGTSDSSGQIDLDRVIGDLETEAARRRAEPGYPHDADARLHFELARRAPNPPDAAAMHEVIGRVHDVATAADAPLDAATRPMASRRHRREVVQARLHETGNRVSALGLAAAAALRAVTGRLEQLEERVRHLEPPTDDSRGARAPSDDSGALEHWRARLAETLPTDARVLYAQSEADEVVADLRASGIDAYGITTRAPRHRPGPDVRSGDVLSHLGGVPDDALGAVVLTGVPEVMGPHAVAPLVAELARATRSVVVISEAPWWWRLRLGAVNADLAPGRPLDPDTWLHAFHGVSMVGTVEYDPAGHSYRLVVAARE